MRIADALLDSEGRILEDAWADAEVSELPVGTCHCGAPALAVGTSVGHRLAPRVFYEARCLMDGEHEAVIPASKALARWSRPIGATPELLAAGRARDAAILGEHDD